MLNIWKQHFFMKNLLLVISMVIAGIFGSIIAGSIEDCNATSSKSTKSNLKL